MLEKLNEKINEIKEMIGSFDTDERKEIKKNNKYINETVLELEEYKNKIYEEILRKKDNYIPKNNLEVINNIKKELDKLFDNINYLSDKSYISKLGIDKIIYNIKNGENLNEINNEIKKLIDIFKIIDVNLSCEDFKYSLSLYKYMIVYFDNIDKEDFNEIIKSEFDSLYWECPDLVYHVLLCFVGLIEKYRNEFELYIKKINGSLRYDDILLKYNSLREKIDNDMYLNEYLNYNLFLSNELNVNDYIIDSPRMVEVISKFINYDDYKNKDKEDRYIFYNDIRKMYNDLNEYIYLDKFKYLIDRVLEIYSNKDKYQNNFNNLLKNMRTKDKKRIMLCRKLFMIYSRNIQRKSDRLDKKCNSLISNLNKLILEIKDIYKEYNECLFINNVITKINDNSTYYDVIKLYEDNYGYLCEYMKDNEKDDYDEIINYLYNKNLIISKSLCFNSDINIKEKLENKYNLFEFDFILDDNGIMEIKNNLEYFCRLSYLEEGNISVDNIKLILDINKLKKD